MKYLIFLALFCVLAQDALAAPSDKVDCSKVDEIIDDLGAQQGITTMNEKHKIDTTAEDQAKRCVRMADAIKTLRKYNKECFSSLTQQVFSAILRTRSQFNEEACKDSSSSLFKESLEAAKCVAEKATDTVREAERKTIVSFQVLHEANIADDKLRVRRACCSVIEAKKAFLGATKEKCAAHEKVYNNYVDSYTSESMGLICPEVDKLECDKLEPIKTDGVTHKNTFFLTPMIKVIKLLDH